MDGSIGAVEREASLREVRRFVDRAVEPRVERPETPMSLAALGALLDEAEGLGFAGSADEPTGLGAWETLIASAAQRYPLAIVTKQLADGGVNRFVMRMRRRFGVGMFPTRDSLLDLLRHLKQSGVIGFVIDQDMPPGRGVFVRFFGRWAATTEGLALLAKASGAPVVPVFAYRRPDGRHLFEVLPAIAYETMEDKKRELVHNTARYSEVVEEAIRREPSAWLWLHRRWKTQPASEHGQRDQPYLVLSRAERSGDRRVV